MRIVAARITGFRNLADTDLRCGRNVNLVFGANGQGKTNLLEALHFPALGRSHRGSRQDDLIAFGRDTLHVALELEAESGGRSSLEYGIERGGVRRFRADGSVIARRADLVGRLTAVYFDPATVRLVRGGPENRRRFLDIGLAQIDRSYLLALAAYHRALRQKAQILREIRVGTRTATGAKSEARSWNEELARQAVVVIRGRSAYVAALAAAAATAHAAMDGLGKPLELRYRPSLASARKDPEKHDLEQDIRAEIDYIWSDEVRRGQPLRGPQRDDLIIRMAGRDLRTFGSQGETRTAAIAMVLGQSEVVQQRRGTRPVLFLDDIFSELDRQRARRLQELAANEHQIFVATARRDDVADWLPTGRRVWSMAGGVLTAQEDDCPMEPEIK